MDRSPLLRLVDWLAAAAVVAAVPAAFVAGVGPLFLVDEPGRGDWLAAAGADLGAGLCIALLAALSGYAFGCGRWLAWLTAVACLPSLLYAARELWEASRTDGPRDNDYGVVDCLRIAAGTPFAWPLLALAAVAVLVLIGRAWHSRRRSRETVEA